jgi:dienelactone hydrolase
MNLGNCALALILAAGLAQAQELASPAGVVAIESRDALQPEHVLIPIKGAGLFGRDLDMVTQLFKPSGDGPFPVVLFSHGRAGDAIGRSKLTQPVSKGQVRYWTAHGFAILAPIRPGYGATGGSDVENSGAVFSTPPCAGRPDFGSVAAAGERATLTALAWLREQPWAEPDRILLVGQSVGGLVTVATASHQLQGVIGYVNFAGGSGGNPDRSPGRSCAPEELTALYGEFGKTTTIPNLWIYAQNDQYWGAQMPALWHEAFARNAKGTPASTTFVHAPPVADGDGHGLSRHSQALWAPYLDSFLSSLGAIN